MLIGIHGKKEHGKDELAKLIQFLIFEEQIRNNQQKFFTADKDLPHKVFIRWDDLSRAQYSGWEKKMFAEKLKQMVCMLIGCTMADLENQAFKEKPLGKGWDKWYIRNETYSLSQGLFRTEEEARAAYNRIKDPRNPNHQEQMAWYDPMGDIKISFQKHVMTPRLMMQLLGTECGREIIHPDIWILALFADYVPAPRAIGLADRSADYPDWIITDVRFLNEVEAIRAKGGLVFKIYRPGMEDKSRHESETALDDYPNSWFDGYVLNNGTPDSFIEVIKDQAEELLHHHKIIV